MNVVIFSDAIQIISGNGITNTDTNYKEGSCSKYVIN